MREIKFRGKCRMLSHFDEWVNGNYLFFENSGIATHQIKICQGEGKDAFVAVDGDTIGQFTGLHDKNGKEIYEGDILKFYDDPCFIGEVCYSEDTSAFMIEAYPSDGNLEYLGGQDTSYSLIIGNIHDNPELLEELI